MLGRAKCKILKEIRQKIADENDIPYVTRECTYQGDCSGTCPRCESELRYLERELEARQRVGKAVAVTALCAGLALGASGCDEDGYTTELAGAPEAPPIEQIANPDGTVKTDGAGQTSATVVPDAPEPELAGALEPEPEDIIELAGDVEYIPPEDEGEDEIEELAGDVEAPARETDD
ncbi:MAG: hypothetical protein E7474_11045 [Ruminococcaceae bacterium]|nr:hypothetical protein [Oscillospiraceae bacterium]